MYIQIHIKEILGIREDKQHREPSLVEPYYYALIILASAAAEDHQSLLDGLPEFLDKHTKFVETLYVAPTAINSDNRFLIADQIFQSLNNPHISYQQIRSIIEYAYI